MYNDGLKDTSFDNVIKSAFDEYLDREFAKLPTDEELAQSFPISKKSLRKAQKRAKELYNPIYLPLRTLRRVCAITLVILALSIAAFNTDTTVGALAKDNIIEVFEKFATINLSNAEYSGDIFEESATVESLKIGYIPDKFNLRDSYELSRYRRYSYSSEGESYLLISIYTTYSVKISVDSEVSKITKMTINGNNAYLSYNEKEKYGTIVTGNPLYSIVVTGYIDKKELIKIAENIK